MQQIEADVADQPLVQDLQAVEEEQLPLPLESGDNPAESPGEVRSLPLEESMSLENLVRRAHCGLGHIGNERLASILRHAKARPEAIQIAKKLVCSVCLQHKRVDGARKGAPPRNLDSNQIVGVDTVWLPGYHQSGKLKTALTCVCWSTRFQLMIPLSDHTPHGTRKAFYQWIRIFAPPDRVYCDLGSEFKAVFEEMAEQPDFELDPGSPEAPTPRAITERAGKTFEEILSKSLMHTGCSSWDEWRTAVDVVNATVSRLFNKSGFSPSQRMLGFNPGLPGALLSGGQEDHGSASRFVDQQVQRSVELRKQAAIAFHEADCSQALRHAVRSSPKKIYDYEPGQTVYFWRKGMERGRKETSR